MASMQSANILHNALKKGTTTFGGWQMLAGTNLARIMARTGIEWICVDTEHGNLDDGAMHEAVTAIAATQQCSPIVRIPANEPWMVKRALDAGAHGIMVPLLQTAEDAQKLVKSAKFPPRGMRGFGSPFSPGSFAISQSSMASSATDVKIPTSTEYLQQANDSLLTIIQIETRDALDNVDAIAQVPGIDVLFVGPFDLGNNIGHPILTGEMDAELKASIEKVKTAAQKAGKYTGMYCVSGEQARQFADQGFNMISIGGDVIALGSHMGQQLSAARGGILHGVANAAKGAASVVTGPYGR